MTSSAPASAVRIAHPTPLARMVLISFLDATDKCDLLFHEIRQLQLTLIHQIGLPRLAVLLRYEEAFLWGDRPEADGNAEGSWARILMPLSIAAVREKSRVLAKNWVVRFPPPGGPLEPDPETAGAEGKPAGEAAELYALAAAIMQNAANAGLLTQELRRLHFLLSSLQTMKQQLLREKIILVHAALRAFWIREPSGEPVRAIPPVPGAPDDEWQKLAGDFDPRKLQDFLLTRFAFNAQLQFRVRQIGHLQRQIEQLLDLSLEQDPRPSAARRRDQGIYTGAIVDRCLTIQRCIQGLFQEGLKAPDPLNEPGWAKKEASRLGPFIMHRWDLSATSSYEGSVDAIYANRAWDPRATPLGGKNDAPNRYSETRYVNSSYWMPDRPDLQPQLAHEIAHAELEGRYLGFSLHVLAGADDDFATLMQAIRAAISAFTEAAEAEEISFWRLDAKQLQAVLEEIAVDIVAASVVGPAYAFAGFHELLGAGFAPLLHGAVDSIDFDLDLQAETFERLEEFNFPPIWYLRLRATCALIRALPDKDNKPAALSDVLLDGIEQASRLFFTAFHERAPSRARSRWQNWKYLADTIADIIGHMEGRAFLKTARRYTEVKAWNDLLAKRMPDSPRNEPQDLNKRLRTLLLGPLLDRLAEDPRLLWASLREGNLKDNAQLETLFTSTYITRPSDRLAPDHERPFAWLHDIPWQWALITSLDLLARPANGQSFETLAEPAGASLPSAIDRWLRAVHRLNWLGRDVFQLGLEFHVWISRPDRGLIETCARAIMTIKHDLAHLPQYATDRSLQRLTAMIEKWLVDDKKISPVGHQPNNWTDVQTEKSDNFFKILHQDIEKSLELCDHIRSNVAEKLYNSQFKQRIDMLCWYIDLANDPLSRANFPKLATALGHSTEGPAAIGRGRNHRIERISSRAHLLPGAHRNLNPNAPGDFERGPDALSSLHASPWLDQVDNRAWPCLGGEPRRSSVQCLPLLGRYDQMRIESARTLAPSALPVISVQERHRLTEWQSPAGSANAKSAQLSKLARSNRINQLPFFIRQQFGLPFRRSWTEPSVIKADENTDNAWKAQGQWARIADEISLSSQPQLGCAHEWLLPDEPAPALAIISIQLAQRSARLTLLNELLERIGDDKNHVWGEFTKADMGFLIDGWGDLLLVLHMPRDKPSAFHHLPSATELAQSEGPQKFALRLARFHAALEARMKQIIQLNERLVNHLLVARTELAWTSLVADSALRAVLHGPHRELHWSVELRMKPDRSSGLAHERFTRSFRDGCQELFNWAASIGLPGAKELLTLPRLVRRSGTGDYRLSLVGTNNARRALKRLIFCENGLLCSRYRTLAAELAGKHPIPAGHIHIPGAALFLETLFPDKGAAESIDNTFTIIGKRERWT